MPLWNVEDIVKDRNVSLNHTNSVDIDFDLSTNACTSINDFPKGKGLKIAHLNIRSLRNKVDDLQLYLKENPYEILTLSETWLSENICNSLLQIDGYHLKD